MSCQLLLVVALLLTSSNGTCLLFGCGWVSEFLRVAIAIVDTNFPFLRGACSQASKVELRVMNFITLIMSETLAPFSSSGIGCVELM